MSIGNYLKNIFSKKDEDNKTGEVMPIKYFDIIVKSQDEGGKIIEKHQSGVQAESARQLIMLYRNCGEDIQILREYSKDNDSVMQNPQIQAPVQVQNKQFVLNQPVEQHPHNKIKYFRVGDIECKLDKNELYQKQWIRLNQNELNDYRLIQDSNNKIIPLNGKHLEMLKWIKIEDDNSAETNYKKLLNE